MKTIGDEYIRRVVGNEGNGGASSGGGGGSIPAGSFVTPDYYSQNVGLLYKQVTTDGTTGTVTTAFELAAPNMIPTEGTETDPTTGNVVVTSLIGPQVKNALVIGNIMMVYDETNNAIKVVNRDGTTAANFYATGGVSALGYGPGGGGGATTLADLLDVNISNPTNGQVLTYNSATGKWVNAAGGGGGGISMSDVWTALAAGTSEQIDASHLSDALNGYATQQWVGQQGFLTSSAISDMATKTWVGQQGFLTSSSISDMATQTWVEQQGFLTSADISNMVTGGSLWGNTFTGNPSIGTSSTHASLNYVSSIFMSGDIKMNNNKAIYIKDSGTTDRSVLTLGSGNVLVLGYGTNAAGYATQLRGATVDYYTYNNNAELHVGQWTSDGQLYIMQGAKGIRIGDALLTWDATNKVLNLTNVTTGQVAHFVASGGVTALQTS